MTEREQVEARARQDFPDATKFEIHKLRPGLFAVEAMEIDEDGHEYEPFRVFYSVEARQL